MSTLPDRPNTALLVIDVQQGIVAGTHRRDEVIANIGALIEAARAQDVPVVRVQHCDDRLERGSAPWQYVEELVRLDREPSRARPGATPSRTPTWSGSSRSGGWAGSSSPGRRPTRASARPCTAPSSAATT